MWLLRAAAPLVLVAAAARVACAQCAVSCTIVHPSADPAVVRAGEGIGFQGSRTTSGACGSLTGRWTISDGAAQSSDYFLHPFAAAGSYTASYSVHDWPTPGAPYCTASRHVTVVPPTCAWKDAAVVVEQNDPATLSVVARAAGSADDCAGLPITHVWWSWGDGSPTQLVAGVTATHTFPAAKWRSIRATPVVGGETSFVSFQPGVGVLVDVGVRSSVTVGSLQLWGDRVGWKGDDYTLEGHVTVNGALAVAGRVTFQGTPATGEGTLRTDGALSVATLPGPSTLLSGPGQRYAVDGTVTPGALVSQHLFAPTELGLRLQGVPLYVNGDEPIEVSAAGVDLPATLYVGRRDGFHLAELEVDLTLVPGSGVGVGVEPRVVALSEPPGVELESHIPLQFDPQLDLLGGFTRARLPFLDVRAEDGTEDLYLELLPENGCIDTLGTSAAGEGFSLWLLGGVRPGFGSARLLLAGLCAPAGFATLLQGDLAFESPGGGTGVPASTWQYLPPRAFRLLAGTPRLAGLPVTGGGATFGAVGDTDLLLLSGSCRVGGVAEGTLRAGIRGWPQGVEPESAAWTVVGVLSGSLTLSSSLDSCPCPAEGGDACTLARAALTQSGSTTYAIVEFDVEGWGLASVNGGEVRFAARDPIGRALDVTVTRTTNSEGGATAYAERCRFGGNLAPAQVAPAPLAALQGAGNEVPVTFAAPEEPALFGCVGTAGALPAITLQTPAGAVITPATAGMFPGVSYAADAATPAAVFTVASAAPGTWVLRETALSAGAARCSVLTAVPPPQIAFAAVEQDGDEVRLDVAVTPAAASTTVDLLYSRLADGVPEGTIAEDLPAGGGTVGATWSTAALPSGGYFVIARADDGRNVPVTAVRRPAIAVASGTLQSPTGVAVTRIGDGATVTWKASAAAAGYTVLYSDRPGEDGYPESAAATLPDGATVTGLDPRSPYRFAVVAWDRDGSQSPPSAPVVAPALGRVRRVVPPH